MRTSITLLLSLFFLIGCSQEGELEEDLTPPLISAAENGDLPTLRQLLEENRNIDIRDSCQWTPLMKAALNGHLEATRQLLIADAAVNLTDKGGYSAMMLAASNNHGEIVELLLNEGADVDQVENTNGWTALIWAAKQGHLNTVQILLHHQADPDLQDFQGKRAIDWATDGGFAGIVSLINTSQ